MRFVHHRAPKSLILFLAAVTFFTACAPPGPRALLQGKKLLEEGKYSEAVEKLRKATVLLGNTNAHAFNYLGLACQQAGLPAEAEKSYQRALALNRDLTEAHYNLDASCWPRIRLSRRKRNSRPTRCVGLLRWMDG